MGHIIAVLSQKGGTGKSTITRAMATCYAAADWQVKIADLDINQSTSFDWLTRRLNNNIQPEVAVEAFGNTSKALKQADHYDLLVVDGAPTASRATLEVSQAADLIILPTGMGLDDLKPTIKLAHELKKQGIEEKRICFVFNNVDGSDIEYQENIDFLKQTPYQVIEGRIEKKPCYRQAMNDGRSIIETKFKKPREKAEAVIQNIINYLETFEG